MTLTRRSLFAAAGLTVPGVARADEGVTFPFAMTRNRPWAAVQVAGKDPPLAFMIDTGASGFCIRPSKAALLGLAKIGVAHGQALVGRQDYAAYAASLVLGGAVRQDRSPMYGVEGLPQLIDGLIPLPRFQLMGMDFDRRQVLLVNSLPKGLEGYQALDLTASPIPYGSVSRFGDYSTDFENQLARDHRPVIDAELDGEAVKLMVDTGSDGGLFLYPDYVKRKGLWDYYPEHRPGRARTAALTCDTRTVRAQRFKLGRIAFANPIVTLADPAASNLDGTGTTAGLIGMELIRRLNFIFHPLPRRLWIKPSAAIADGYRYDRAGAEVDVVGGEARVVSLAPGSAAERAGLQLNDKVTGWRGKDGVDGLSWALKGAPGSTVDIQIERGGSSQMVSIVLEDLI